MYVNTLVANLKTQLETFNKTNYTDKEFEDYKELITQEKLFIFNTHF
jgi:hypothetical protein